MAETLVKQNANISDTVRLISDRIKIDFDSEFIRALVDKLSVPGCPTCLLPKLQDWVYKNVKYKLDPVGRERVLRPETTVSNGEGDCKKMAVIIASALKAAGIPAYLKHTFFEGKDFTHIYVISPKENGNGYYTLDPVDNEFFDREISYDHANVYDLNGNKMDLYTGQAPKSRYTMMAPAVNVGCRMVDDDLNMISGRSVGAAGDAAMIELMLGDPELMSGYRTVSGKSKEKRKENREKLKEKLKDVGLLPIRGAFLAIIGINALKMADRMLSAFGKNPAKVKSFWTSAGGDWDNLKGAIAHGTGQRIAGSIGVVAAAAAAATIALALPLIDQAVRMFKDLGVKGSAEDDQVFDESVEKAEDTGADPSYHPAGHINTIINPASSAAPGNRPPTAPTAGGDSFTQINWTDPYQIGYIIFRTGFYLAVAKAIVSSVAIYL